MIAFKLWTQKYYPKSVYFGSESYKIVFKKNFDAYGETDYEKKTITIKDGLPPRELLDTFIHECLHALAEESGFKLKHKIIYLLAHNVVDFLIDNILICR